MTTGNNDIFYMPEDGYWTGRDRLGFEAANLHAEWPECKNDFVSRMAIGIAAGRSFEDLTLDQIRSLVGALVSKNCDTIFKFRFNVCPWGKYSLTLISMSSGIDVPIRSDNACAFEIATSWVSFRRPVFEVSFSSGAAFWVHHE